MNTDGLTPPRPHASGQSQVEDTKGIARRPLVAQAEDNADTSIASPTATAATEEERELGHSLSRDGGVQRCDSNSSSLRKRRHGSNHTLNSSMHGDNHSRCSLSSMETEGSATRRRRLSSCRRWLDVMGSSSLACSPPMPPVRRTGDAAEPASSSTARVTVSPTTSRSFHAQGQVRRSHAMTRQEVGRCKSMLLPPQRPNRSTDDYQDLDKSSNHSFSSNASMSLTSSSATQRHMQRQKGGTQSRRTKSKSRRSAQASSRKTLSSSLDEYDETMFAQLLQGSPRASMVVPPRNRHTRNDPPKQPRRSVDHTSVAILEQVRQECFQEMSSPTPPAKPIRTADLLGEDFAESYQEEVEDNSEAVVAVAGPPSCSGSLSSKEQQQPAASLLGSKTRPASLAPSVTLPSLVLPSHSATTAADTSKSNKNGLSLSSLNASHSSLLAPPPTACTPTEGSSGASYNETAGGKAHHSRFTRPLPDPSWDESEKDASISNMGNESREFDAALFVRLLQGGQSLPYTSSFLTQNMMGQRQAMAGENSCCLPSPSFRRIVSDQAPYLARTPSGIVMPPPVSYGSSRFDDHHSRSPRMSQKMIGAPCKPRRSLDIDVEGMNSVARLMEQDDSLQFSMDEDVDVLQAQPKTKTASSRPANSKMNYQDLERRHYDGSGEGFDRSFLGDGEPLHETRDSARPNRRSTMPLVSTTTLEDDSSTSVHRDATNETKRKLEFDENLRVHPRFHDESESYFQAILPPGGTVRRMSRRFTMPAPGASMNTGCEPPASKRQRVGRSVSCMQKQEGWEQTVFPLLASGATPVWHAKGGKAEAWGLPSLPKYANL